MPKRKNVFGNNKKYTIKRAKTNCELSILIAENEYLENYVAFLKNELNCLIDLYNNYCEINARIIKSNANE